MSADQTGEKEKYLLVTTTGPAAGFAGGMFGLYREAGTHHGAPYYVQLHDVNTDKEPFKIYKDNNVLYGVAWKAGLGLGDTIPHVVCCTPATPTPSPRLAGSTMMELRGTTTLVSA